MKTSPRQGRQGEGEGGVPWSSRVLEVCGSLQLPEPCANDTSGTWIGWPGGPGGGREGPWRRV